MRLHWFSVSKLAVSALLVAGALAWPAAVPRTVAMATTTGLQNPGFEDGNKGVDKSVVSWQSDHPPGGAVVVVSSENSTGFLTYASMGPAYVNPYRGSLMLRLGFPTGPSQSQNPGENKASQTFTPNSTNLTFSFRLFSWEFRGGDIFRFNLTDSGGNRVGSLTQFPLLTWSDGTAFPPLTDTSPQPPGGGWGFSLIGKVKNGTYLDTGWQRVTITLPNNYQTLGQLTLTYAVGGTSSSSHPTWAYFDNVNTPPIARFTFDPALPVTIFEGARMRLVDTSYDPDPGDKVVAWKWVVTRPGIANSQNATAQNPYFVPPDDGNYTVSLTVTDTQGASNTVISGIGGAWGTATDRTPVPPLVVHNASPQVKPLNIEIEAGRNVSLVGRFLDHGRLDKHTATWYVPNALHTASLPIHGTNVTENSTGMYSLGTVIGGIAWSDLASAIGSHSLPYRVSGTLTVTDSLPDSENTTTTKPFFITVIPTDNLTSRETNDNRNGNNNNLSGAPVLTSGSVYSSFIQSAGDVDAFEIKRPGLDAGHNALPPPVPGEDPNGAQSLPAGSQVLVTAKGLPADYDLALVAVPPVAPSGSVPLGGFDIGGFDIGGFDIGGFDIGGFDIGGFDIGGFDIGGFDIGGFDIGGFDIGGFDIGGFDIGGFDIGGFDIGGFDIGKFDTGGFDIGGFDIGNTIKGTDIQPSDLGLSSFNVPNATIVGFSANRGTKTESVATRIGAEGTRLFAVVVGANGAFSTLPYSLQIEAWLPPTLNVTGTPLVSQSVPQNEMGPFKKDPRTLFVTQLDRLAARYKPDAATWTNFSNNLTALASLDSVHGDIISLPSSIYDNWDTYPADVNQANVVSGEIRNIIQGYVQGSVAMGFAPHPTIQYVVLVGSDDIVPYRRVPDETEITNERLYALSSFLKPGSPLFASLMGGYNLTDDYYVDSQPTPFRGRELYIPNMPIGRLVETPQEITGDIGVFVAKQGKLIAKNAFVTGYDGFIDGAQAISGNLTAALGSGNVTSLNSDFWTAAQLSSALLGTPRDIDSVNAHFAHFAALSASGFISKTADLLTSDTVSSGAGRGNVLPGKVVFSMGCHAGLNVPDYESEVADNGTGFNPALDFAQAMARQQAFYIANTGFGLGDDEGVGGSELLLSILAKKLVHGSPTIGSALVQAKQRYLAGLSTMTEYDEKVSIESTLYGLPMYQILLDPSAPGSTTGVSGGTDPLVTLKDGQSTTEINYVRQQVTTADGTYYTANDDSQATPGRAIQPRIVVPMPVVAGNPVHGVLLTGGSFRDSADGFDPVIARPTNEWEENVQEPKTSPPSFWPTDLAAVNTLSSANQTLVVIPGQFRATSKPAQTVTGIQRLFDSLSFNLLRSNSPDWQSPTINSVDLASAGTDRVVVSVNATDDKSGIARVVVLRVHAGTVSDNATTVSDQNGMYTLTEPWTDGDKLIIQVVDGANNVATYSAKGAALGLINVDAGPDKAYEPGHPVTFNATVTSGFDKLVPPVFYTWNFGDGQSTSGQTTTNTFSANHTYNGSVFQTKATLKVTDSDGGIGVDSVRVTERSSPIVTVGSSVNPSIIGQPVTFTANVSANTSLPWLPGPAPLFPWEPTPSGTVTFTDNGAFIGTSSLAKVTDGLASATFTTSSLSSGNHTIAATYDGDAFFYGVAGSMAQTLRVMYNFGFQSPISGSTYNVGRQIPVKFIFQDYSGNSILTLKAMVIFYTSDNQTRRIGLANPTGGYYHLNVDTNGFPSGPLTIGVDLSDGTPWTTYSENITLK